MIAHSEVAFKTTFNACSLLGPCEKYLAVLVDSNGGAKSVTASAGVGSSYDYAAEEFWYLYEILNLLSEIAYIQAYGEYWFEFSEVSVTESNEVASLQRLLPSPTTLILRMVPSLAMAPGYALSVTEGDRRQWAS